VVVMYANLYFLLVMYGSVHNIIVVLPSVLRCTSISANHYVKLNYMGFHFSFIFSSRAIQILCSVVRNCFAVFSSPEFIRNVFDVSKLSGDRVLKILNLTVGRYK
jgi:hypothetical protein